MAQLHTQPHDIERASFEIIARELGDRELDPLQAPIIKRVIHTTADFLRTPTWRAPALAAPR